LPLGPGSLWGGYDWDLFGMTACFSDLPSFQVTYFSLWYYNKQNQRRWVDLEKPLKKQLDKHALEPTVYFGVLFYVPSVSQLQQEITR
jgi:hypothetical protein